MYQVKYNEETGLWEVYHNEELLVTTYTEDEASLALGRIMWKRATHQQ